MFNPSDWPIAWMARAERQHARNATQLLAPLGLHHREFRLLADRAVLERPTVSKMVDRLQLEGWVERGAHPQDRRRSPLRLTPAGRAKFDAAVPIVEDLFHRYQAGVPAPAQAQFIHALEAFYHRVHRARPQEPPATTDPEPGGRPRPQSQETPP